MESPSFLKYLIITAVLSLACTTKVSEWFLLNADPDKYLLVYFHNNDIPEFVTKRNLEFENKSIKANLVMKTVHREDINEPYYALYYKNRLFSKYRNLDAMQGFLSSPVREKIASELMAGKLSVLVYLTSGNQENDDKGLQVLKNTVAASPYNKIVTIIELNRNNAEEVHFISMLLNIESDLKDIHEPMVYGVFGRFRVLEPLIAKGISEENLNLLLDFLSADCSCLIKDNLPGINILYNSSWENPQPAMVNQLFDDNPNLFH